MAENGQNLKRGAIVNIRKPYDDLVAENEIYYRGQMVWAETTFGSGLGLKLGTKDVESGANPIPFNQLPWVIDPNSPIGGNQPFVVRNSDISYTYNSTTQQIIIVDAKLVGVNDPIATTTQNNITFRDADLTVDKVNGILIINADAIGGGLLNGEKISIFTGSGVLPNQVDNESRLQAIERKITVLVGCSIWWPNKDTIPDGWIEDVSMRGLFPLHYNPDDADILSTGLTYSGSGKSFTISNQNLPKTSLTVPAASNASVPANGRPGGAGYGAYGDATVPTSSFGVNNPTPISIIPAYKTGIWIKYIT